ncbi:MAG: hypothetical protein ACI8PD_000350 [Nitrospinales bacterium]|jgi:hypothetical protein
MKKIGLHKANLSLQISFAIMILAILFSGCGTAGKNFDASLYANIVKGTTTHKEVQAMFGPPFKKGIQNGYSVWTYEYNHINSFGSDIIKDMIIVFEKNGVVKSHQLMTNTPE